MPKFKIDFSQDLIGLSERLNYLANLHAVTEMKFDQDGRTWFNPNDANAPRLSFEEYDDLYAEYEQVYTDDEFDDLTKAAGTARAKTQKIYDDLKAALLSDAAKSGDPGSAKLIFDDAVHRIGIDYGFKECMDRFGKQSKDLIKSVVIDDPAVAKGKYLQDIFRDNLTSQAFLDDYDKLFEETTRDNRDKGAAAYKDPKGGDVDLSGANTAADTIDATFAGQDGICLDDNHSKPDSKDFLIDNMADLKAKKVDTLFIEHFWQEHQTMLDDFLNGPPDADMAPPLKEAVRKLNLGVGKDSDHFTKLLQTAKTQKVRIVGLDSFESKTAQDGDPRNWDQRAARFNATAAEVVEREKGGGKFVLMAGDAHNNTHFSGFPGLAQMLGIPAMKTDGGKLNVSPEKKSDRGMRSEAEQAYYDAYIDDLKQKHPEVFQSARPGDIAEDSKAQLRQTAIRDAANKTARHLGASLGELTPDAVKRLAEQASDRTVKAMTADGGGLDLQALSDVRKVLSAGSGRSVEETEARNELRAAVAKGSADDVLKVLKANPNDDRLLLEFKKGEGALGLNDGAGLLHLAAVKGNSELAQLLLGRGSNPNSTDDKGETALHTLFSNSSRPDHIDVADDLLKGGADIAIEDDAGNTPVQAMLKAKRTADRARTAKPYRDALARVNQSMALDGSYANAKKPKNDGHVLDLVFDGDVSEIRALAQNDPVLNRKSGDKNLIHIAAENRDIDMLRALVDQGADLTAKDNRGENALHFACKDGTDDAVLAKYLLDGLGDRAAEPNDLGKTALHLAATNNLPAVAREMLTNKNQHLFNIPDNTELRPLEYAIGKSDTSQCEQVFYAADPTLDETAPPASGAGDPSVVDTLMWMTHVQSHDEFPDGFLRNMLTDLYDDPTLRPVLEIAARDGIGGRAKANPGDRQGLRLLMSGSVGSVGGGGMGNYMTEGNRLNFGGKQKANEAGGYGEWTDAVKGTLIHELSHHAAAVAFKNDGLPVHKADHGPGNNTDEETAYIAAFETDVKQSSHLAITDEEKEIVRSISSRLQPYQNDLQLPGRTFSGRENMQLELIVGVSQAIAQFGEPLVKKLYPNFTTYFEDTFNAEIKESCKNDSVFKTTRIDTQKDLDPKRSVAALPEKMFTDADGISADSIWSMIKKDYLLEKGKPTATNKVFTDKGVPIYAADNLELSQADETALKAMEKDVRKLIDNALSSKKLPPQLSCEAVRDLVRDVSESCKKGLSEKAFKKAIKNKGSTFVDAASADFETDYLSSAKQCLDRKLAKSYTLKPRDIAEMTLVRGAEAAAQTDAGGANLSIDPGKFETTVAFLTKQLTDLTPEQFAKIQKDPGTFVDKEVAALTKAGDFYVKKKNTDSGHVSLNVKDLKKVWIKELRGLL